MKHSSHKKNTVKLLWALAGSLTASCALAQTTAQTVIPSARSTLPAATVAQIDALIQSAMKEQNLPGVAVGVWIPGRGIYVAAFGRANLETGRARQIGDPFRIASISKTFTATAILQLADQGRLNTGDLLSKWFPNFPGAGAVTVRDLLMMRSGIPEFADEAVMDAYYRDPLEAFSAQDAIRLAAAKVTMSSPPDHKTVYINTNYVLLQQIVERVSGQPINTFLGQNVFAPLGLGETFYATGPELPGNLRGYSWEAQTKTFRDLTELNPALPGGAGAMVSTLNDLHTYVRALCTGQLLKTATQAQRLAGMQMDGEPAFIQYGEGVLQLGPFCGHNGTIFGFSSEAFYLPAEDAVVVVNVNRLDLDDHSQSTELFLRLTKTLFPGEVPW